MLRRRGGRDAQAPGRGAQTPGGPSGAGGPGRADGVPTATWRAVRDDLLPTVRRHRLGLAVGGATFHGALAVVPSLLVAVALAGLILGPDAVRRDGARLAHALPEGIGAPGAVEAVVAAGLRLPWWGVLFAVVMGSAYGSGLSRCLLVVAPVPRQDPEARRPGWWQRALTLPLLGLAPLTLCGFLLAVPHLTRLGTGTLPARALGLWASLTLIWVLTWAPLTWTFRVVGPGRPAWRAAGAGAVVGGAFVSGFLHGFGVFLALPVDLGRPFGGLTVVGVATGLLLWLWVLHAVVCVAYALVWAVDARVGGVVPAQA